MSDGNEVRDDGGFVGRVEVEEGAVELLVEELLGYWATLSAAARGFPQVSGTLQFSSEEEEAVFLVAAAALWFGGGFPLESPLQHVEAVRFGAVGLFLSAGPSPLTPAALGALGASLPALSDLFSLPLSVDSPLSPALAGIVTVSSPSPALPFLRLLSSTLHSLSTDLPSLPHPSPASWLRSLPDLPAPQLADAVSAALPALFADPPLSAKARRLLLTLPSSLAPPSLAASLPQLLLPPHLPAVSLLLSRSLLKPCAATLEALSSGAHPSAVASLRAASLRAVSLLAAHPRIQAAIPFAPHVTLLLERMSSEPHNLPSLQIFPFPSHLF